MGMDFSKLVSEAVNQSTLSIDKSNTQEILEMINNEDKTVAYAIEKELFNVERAVDAAYNGISAGGRLFYVGAGTSGRLGVLDASECPPTYHTPPEMVQGFIAGGDLALRTAIEGAEDDSEAGKALIKSLDLNENDVLVGVTASGTAPFVIGAVQYASKKGATTVALVTNPNTNLAEFCDIIIAPIVGAEVITGSTRMKSGTAQKLVLNMISTAVMVKLGKVYQNLMVDLNASNAKLHNRSLRIIADITGVSLAEAKSALQVADNNVKTAIVIIKRGCGKKEAEALLLNSAGRLRDVLESK